MVTVTELKARAKRNGLKGYSKLKKNELLKLVGTADEKRNGGLRKRRSKSGSRPRKRRSKSRPRKRRSKSRSRKRRSESGSGSNVSFLSVLTIVVEDFVAQNLDQSIVLSNYDIETYLEHWVDLYENRYGKILSDDQFKKINDKIVTTLIENESIYKYGNKESYISIVKDNDLISLMEHIMKKDILESGKATFRDTEFPINKHGEYIIYVGKKIKKRKK